MILLTSWLRPAMHCKWQSKLHVYNKNYPNPQPKVLVVAVAQLVWWLLNHMPATYWEVLVRAGFESQLRWNFSGSASGLSGHA